MKFGINSRLFVCNNDAEMGEQANHLYQNENKSRYKNTKNSLINQFNENGPK